MTAAHLTVAHCGEVSALTLGLPASAAIPEQKGTLPKGLFVAKAPVSSKLKQRLVNDIASITMLALLRPANTAMGAGSGKMPEVLVIGLRVNTPGIPVEVIDLIAGQRKSGIVFVCVHEGEFEGVVREECALAVRRNVPAGRSCADHESVLRRMEAVRRGHAGTTGRERRRRREDDGRPVGFAVCAGDSRFRGRSQSGRANRPPGPDRHAESRRREAVA